MTQRDAWRGVVAAGLISLAISGLSANAQGVDPEIELSNQARHWEAQGRDDLARDSWLRLLRVSRDNPSALAGLALAEARTGRQSAAGVYLERLRKVAPDHPDIPRAEAAIRAASFDQKRLEDPRKLAQDGRFDDAVEAYEQAFDGSVPKSRLGLEYYQTLAGTEGGWEPAKKGLEELVAANPDDAIFKVALAQHLTYRESTRREGVKRLATLAEDGTVDVEVKQAWRQGLIWLSATSADLPLYRGFIKKFGSDTEVGKRLAALEKVGPGGTVATLESGEIKSYPGPQARSGASGAGRAEGPRGPTAEEVFGSRIRQAFEVLNDGDVVRAEQEFAQLVAEQPGNADALGGMGIVMLRQERYAEARNLLERASQSEPNTAQRWREALQSARFWEAVRSADAAREAGQTDEALQRLRSAISANPQIAERQPEVKATLADMLVARGQSGEAEQIYRDLLARDPENLTAVRGLVNVYSQTNRLQEAIALAERLPRRLQNEVGNLSQLRGQFLRDEADTAIRSGDDATAQKLLKEALLHDPESPWTRLSLARIYQREGRTRDANTLVDGLITDGKQLADAYYIKAMLLSEQQDWFNALQVLERIPAVNRTDDMATLQRRLWIRYETERAAVFARHGQLEEAVQILAVVEPYVDETPELLGALATAWAAVGDDPRAMSYMRQALSRVPNPDIGMRLQYAGLLFALRQDAEFEVVMEDLLQQTGFDDQQSLQLANMRIAYRLRQADLVREDGQLAQAYEYLEPLLRVNPNDPRVLMALARLYNDAREYDRVLALSRRVIDVDPDNVDAYRSAINASLAIDDLDQAEVLLDDAFALEPNSSRLYALAGRAARSRGEDGRALQLFQHALRLDQEAGGAEGVSGEGSYSPRLFMLEPQQSPAARQPFMGRAPAAAGWPAPSVDSAKKKPLDPGTPRLAQSVPAAPRGDFVADAWSPPSGTQWVRVSTLADGRSGVQTRGIPGAEGGVWVQQSDDVYVFQPGRAAAAQAPSVPQYDDVRRESRPNLAPQRVTQPRWQMPQSGPVFPRQAPPAASRQQRLGSDDRFRDDVMGEIQSITGEGDPAYAPPARQAYPPGLSTQLTTQRPAPQTAAPQPQIYGSRVAPAPGSPVQGAGQMSVAPGLQIETIRPRQDVQWGAPAEHYEAQGLRLGPAGMAQQLSAPVYTQSQSVPVQRQVQTPAFPARTRQGPDIQLQQDPLLTRPSWAGGGRPALRQDAPGNALMRDIADLRAKRSAWASMGLSIRTRDGVSGLDELTDIEMPVEVSFAGQRAGRIRLRAVPVFLDGGTVSGDQLPLFGALALVDPDVLEGRTFGQSEDGIAVGAAYEVGPFRADIGSSPLGFPIETIVGGLNWQPKMDDTSFKIDLARRSVTDSLLSYAGAFDPGLGEDWGGVTKTGGRIDVSQALGQYGIYANGGYHVYDGESVARNHSYELGAGFYARALERTDMRVTWGLNLTTFAYDKNLRRFTFGHGGYFSPQSYVALAIPVEWVGGRNRLSYRLNASLGIQGFREDGAPLFPNDSGLQAAVDELVLDNPDLDIAGGYPGQSSSGVGFSLGGALEYLITSQLVAGARFGLDNARDYDEAYASAYIRYLMTPQGRVAIPPAPLFPYYNFGDPKL